MTNLRVVINEILKEKKDVLLSVLFGFIAGMAAIGLFSASGYLLSKAAIGVPLTALTVVIAIVKLLGVTRAFSRYGERYYSHRASFTVLGHIRKTFYRRLDQSFSTLMQKYQSGDLLSRMVGDIESLQTYFLRVLYPPMLLFFIFLTTIFFASFFSFWVAAILFIGFILQILVLPTLFYWWLMKTKSTVRMDRTTLSNDAGEYFFGYKELKIFQHEKTQKNALIKASDQYERSSFNQKRKERLHQTIYTWVGYFIIWLVLAAGAYFVSDGDLNGIYLAVFLLLSITLFENSEVLSALPIHLANSQEVSERLSEVEPTGHEDMKTTVSSLGSLQMEQLTFSYPNALSPALLDVSFILNRGSKTAIVGPSGSGKSTIIDLVLGIESTQDGRILWNNELVEKLEPSSLWKHSNVVLQESHFFYGTVRDNLFADSTHTDADMLKVLERVNLSYLDLDSLVLEKGSNLSGGEKQRLAVARTLLKPEAELWLLDEPTSSLDTKNKDNIYRQLWNETEDKTMLLITHELTHLEDMDQIIVLQEGKIVESGTYEELMKRQGEFFQMKQIEDSVLL
ncbi:thiol reductant ABC exporter subunit CydC [Allobacillus halotolerans]|uniref:Thiol reductant ABC exporter subunit CydC n=1 Tax=Allobacillus halotolerans TaxID=570278 RepID=A0ABS6GKE9_9BACI|nr:thiol reductant ABC exporter subunit CydC [Allobacillus halotolerans]MBU6079664.1 thiol reductant ABC exporter subunit CydC [Allobacillus halotolerans]